MTKLSVVSPEEDQIKLGLRTAILNEIERRKMSNDQIAEELNILPTGVSVLLQRSDWSVETGLRVALALNLPVELKASK